MAEFGLSCIVCNIELTNVFNTENQPQEGTSFQSYGQYGSTAFDPMNGNYIEINVCDPCLRKASDKQQVILARTHKPVVAVLEGSRHPIKVGTTKAERLPVLWDHASGIENDDEALEIEPEEVDTDVKGVDWAPAFRRPS